MLSCASQTAPTTSAPALPVSGTASRVVLVSFDGLSADELPGRPELQAFHKLAADGFFVQRVIPVTPSATAVAHVAMITGAQPNVTGIVANRFHQPNTPWTEVAEGFSADVDAETLVEAAHRAGKRVGSIAFPSVDFRGPRRSADWGLSFSQPLTRSRVVHLRRSDFHAEWLPPGWVSSTTPSPRHISYSPVMRARIEWSVPDRTKQEVDLAAYDTTNDNTRNYDAFFIETRAGEVRPDAAGWFPVAARLDDALYGSWSKLIHADTTLADVTIYWGSVSRNLGYPDSFRQMIDDGVGFWPGPPDERLAAVAQAGGDGIDGATFAEQNNRMTRFLSDVSALSIRRMPFDFLLVYHPEIDAAEHQFLMVSDAQANATAANRADADRVRASTFAEADRAAATLASSLDPANDALVITGDHGLARAETEVYLGRLLASAGLAGDWAVFASGNVGQFYRITSHASSAALIATLKSTGWFEEVDERTPATHPNAGDVIAYSFPNIGLSATGGAGDIVVKASHYGQHGGLGTHHEFHTALIAWGAGVARGTLLEAHQTQIARFVSRLLGIDPPKNAE